LLGLSGVSVSGSVGSVSFVPALSTNLASGFAGTVTVAERSIALTGVAASGAVGSVAQSIPRTLSGVAATGAVGTTSNSIIVALTGTTASGAVDTVVYGRPLTGVSASGAVGTVVAGFGVAGAQASGSVSTPTSSRTVALTGAASSASVGTMTGEAIYYASLSGNSLAGAVQSVSIGQRLVQITGSQAMGAVGNFGVLYWSVINDTQVPAWEVVNDML
jgi:hypothetical protein